MRNLFPVISLLISLLFPYSALAVTDKEMEQARTIAAKAYLRYANDGSGYLDELNPTTIEELEKSLKNKEKENIKVFKAIPVPSDYKSWDKEKLVNYWSVTAYQTKGLIEKGKLGKTRTKNLISKMTVTPPQKEGASTEKKQENKETQIVDQPATTPAVTSKVDSLAAGIQEASDELAQLNAAEANMEDLFDDANSETQFKKAEDHTWVWIMILGILVAVVIALVVFASNVLKKNERQRRSEEYERNSDLEEVSELRDSIADKDTEIAMLTKKLESVNRQNSDLKHKLESLTAEIASLRQQREANQENYRQSENPKSEHENINRQGNAQSGQLRSIYLGRANSRGIFVRADRNLNIGNSFYRLDTADGFTGTFRVAENPEVWEIALSNPLEYLAGACTGFESENPDGKTRIITESPGTAVFEKGTWRVIRKSKIRFV